MNEFERKGQEVKSPDFANQENKIEFRKGSSDSDCDMSIDEGVKVG